MTAKQKRKRFLVVPETSKEFLSTLSAIQEGKRFAGIWVDYLYYVHSKMFPDIPIKEGDDILFARYRIYYTLVKKERTWDGMSAEMRRKYLASFGKEKFTAKELTCIRLAGTILGVLGDNRVEQLNGKETVNGDHGSDIIGGIALKRKRGRPKKEQTNERDKDYAVEKRKRGRPKKEQKQETITVEEYKRKYDMGIATADKIKIEGMGITETVLWYGRNTDASPAEVISAFIRYGVEPPATNTLRQYLPMGRRNRIHLAIPEVTREAETRLRKALKQPLNKEEVSESTSTDSKTGYIEPDPEKAEAYREKMRAYSKQQAKKMDAKLEQAKLEAEAEVKAKAKAKAKAKPKAKAKVKPKPKKKAS